MRELHHVCNTHSNTTISPQQCKDWVRSGQNKITFRLQNSSRAIHSSRLCSYSMHFISVNTSLSAFWLLKIPRWLKCFCTKTLSKRADSEILLISKSPRFHPWKVTSVWTPRTMSSAFLPPAFEWNTRCNPSQLKCTKAESTLGCLDKQQGYIIPIREATKQPKLMWTSIQIYISHQASFFPIEPSTV